MAETIKCADCRYAVVDKNVCEKNWTAYECGNSRSQYYKSLLNITPDGGMQDHITWHGCVYGERGRK